MMDAAFSSAMQTSLVPESVCGYGKFVNEGVVGGDYRTGTYQRVDWDSKALL
jgi:hypothetical protein